jgi:hypothetical protein
LAREHRIVCKLDADIGEVAAALEQEAFALLGIDAAHLVALPCCRRTTASLSITSPSRRR